MIMRYKDDWDETRRRWTAFWRREIIDRPIMMVTAPVADPPPIPAPQTNEQRWTDPDFLVRFHDAQNRSRHYLGEAVPQVGALMAAWCAYYGGPVQYKEDTIWFEPFVHTWDDLPNLETAWDDEGLRKLKSILRALCEARAGDAFVGYPPTMHSAPSDLLAAMRETNRFLMDLVEYPDVVESSLAVMTRNSNHIYDQLTDLIHSYGYEGYGNWWPVWCPDRLGVFQSDVSCMLSSDMFERFVVPHLEGTSAYVKYGFYHLDGPDAIRHVDRLCEIPGISAVQWVPGAGTKPGALQWMPLFKQLQGHGRAVYFGLAANDVEQVIAELDPRLLILQTSVATVEDAKQLLRNAERWTAKYWGAGK